MRPIEKPAFPTTPSGAIQHFMEMLGTTDLAVPSAEMPFCPRHPSATSMHTWPYRCEWVCRRHEGFCKKKSMCFQKETRDGTVHPEPKTSSSLDPRNTKSRNWMPRAPVHSSFSILPLAPCSTEDQALVTPSSGRDSGEGSADASVWEGRRAHRPAAGRAGEGEGLLVLVLVLVVVLVFMFMLVLVLLLLLLVLMVMVMVVLAVSRGRRLLSKHWEWSRYHGMHSHLQRLLFTFKIKTPNEFLLTVRKDSYPRRTLRTVSCSIQIQEPTSPTELPASWPEVN